MVNLHLALLSCYIYVLNNNVILVNGITLLDCIVENRIVLYCILLVDGIIYFDCTLSYHTYVLYCWFVLLDDIVLFRCITSYGRTIFYLLNSFTFFVA